MTTSFNPSCEACPRLAEFLADVRIRYPGYHARPVAPFGVDDPDLLIVGLAPGLHGANATGRPFTGDYAGILLYETLYDFGFASQPQSRAADDALVLRRCRISNAVKCVPPQNKPTPAEVKECNRYLRAELTQLRKEAVILALGAIAHESVLSALELKRKDYRFAHNAAHELPEGRVLVDSYHCSRYNTQTGRLTKPMFAAVFETVRERLAERG